MWLCSDGVPLSDRGFRYGQHLFETIAIRNGHALFAEEHCERLTTAAEKFHFAFEPAWQQGLRDFLKNIHLNDGMLRLFLTAGDGGIDAPMKTTRLFAFWEETLFPAPEELSRGIALVSLEHPIGNNYWGVKNGNYWEHVCALKEAHRVDAQEGLVFDADDFLISGAMANLFVWLEDPTDTTKNIFATPPCVRGAREGVVRARVLARIFPQCLERDISRTDLLNARAMAVTNSRLGVMPVSKLDGKSFPDFSLSLQLAHEYVKNLTSLTPNSKGS